MRVDTSYYQRPRSFCFFRDGRKQTALPIFAAHCFVSLDLALDLRERDLGFLAGIARRTLLVDVLGVVHGVSNPLPRPVRSPLIIPLSLEGSEAWKLPVVPWRNRRAASSVPQCS